MPYIALLVIGFIIGRYLFPSKQVGTSVLVKTAEGLKKGAASQATIVEMSDPLDKIKL